MSRFVLVATLICTAPAFAQAAYFAQIEDLPVPPGFTEIAGGPPFESEEGRIVFVMAEGRSSSAEQIRAFYSGSLSQLGWSLNPNPDGELVFQRGRETLTFRVREGAARTHLSVRLVTQAAAMNAD